MSWSQKDLFGGAISFEVPTSWRDVSNVRQVPDNQEVFQNTSAEIGAEGACLVIEIMEYQGQVDDSNAASFFFQDLAESNGNEAARFDGAPQLPDQPLVPRIDSTRVTVCTGKGIQTVAIGREFDVGGNARTQTKSSVHVELCVLRLKDVTTDLLITLTSPTPAFQPANNFSDVFLRVLSTLEIRDWGLFG